MAQKIGEPIGFEPISRYKYRIPNRGKMRVDGVFYGSKAIPRTWRPKTTLPCSSSRMWQRCRV